MNEMPELEGWAEWLRALDPAWVFLLILVIVIVVVGLWSKSLRADKDGGPQRD